MNEEVSKSNNGPDRLLKIQQEGLIEIVLSFWHYLKIVVSTISLNFFSFLYTKFTIIVSLVSHINIIKCEEVFFGIKIRIR
ncbi:hypothetical protein B6U98_00105 [Thermoplasmatales archaeon ex4572_165]|nr:MAG: hypothetical protein B6U98_00105 [Thermoplasmatales archaeon ex4572_165]